MRRRRTSPPLLLPHGVRALVPVLAPHGGAGRTTVAGLLAQVLAPTTRTVVVDPQPRAASPWPDWLVDPPAPGLAGILGSGRPPESAALAQAAVHRVVPVRGSRKNEPDTGADGSEGPGYDVLTDGRIWRAPPIPVPEDPGWYAHLVEVGGWFAGIVDIGGSATAAHVGARNAGRPSPLDAWCSRADAVPVVVGSSNGDGLAGLRQLMSGLEDDGVPTSQVIVVVVDTAGVDVGRGSRTLTAELAGRVAATVRMPFDRAIQASGLGRLDRIGDPALNAAREIARVVAGRVRFQPDQAEAGAESVEEPAEDAESARSSGPRHLAGPEQAPPTRPGPPQPGWLTPPDSPGWVPMRHQVADAPYDWPDEPSPNPTADDP